MTCWIPSAGSALLAGDGRHQVPELAREEAERRLVAHAVVGERRLLQLHIDGIAVERGGERYAVLQLRSRARTGGGTCHMRTVGGAERQRLGARASGGAGQHGAEVDD